MERGHSFIRSNSWTVPGLQSIFRWFMPDFQNLDAHPSLLFMAPYHCYNNNMSKLRPVIITNIQSVPEKAIADQRAAYSALLQNLGTASFEKIQKTLDERKSVNPEHGLTPEVIERLKKRIKKKK